MTSINAYFVRYWETKEDYIVWTNDECEYFDNKKQAEKFIKKCLLVDDAPVFAYELGMVDKITEEGCDDVYENHEGFDFYNAEEIKVKVKLIVACTIKGKPDFFVCSFECTQHDVNVGNHYAKAIELAKEDGCTGVFVAYDANDINRVVNKIK